jgi:hypothetical protein
LPQGLRKKRPFTPPEKTASCEELSGIDALRWEFFGIRELTTDRVGPCRRIRHQEPDLTSARREDQLTVVSAHVEATDLLVANVRHVTKRHREVDADHAVEDDMRRR